MANPSKEERAAKQLKRFHESRARLAEDQEACRKRLSGLTGPNEDIPINTPQGVAYLSREPGTDSQGYFRTYQAPAKGRGPVEEERRRSRIPRHEPPPKEIPLTTCQKRTIERVVFAVYHKSRMDQLEWDLVKDEMGYTDQEMRKAFGRRAHSPLLEWRADKEDRQRRGDPRPISLDWLANLLGVSKRTIQRVKGETPTDETYLEWSNPVFIINPLGETEELPPYNLRPDNYYGFDPRETIRHENPHHWIHWSMPKSFRDLGHASADYDRPLGSQRESKEEQRARVERNKAAKAARDAIKAENDKRRAARKKIQEAFK